MFILIIVCTLVFHLFDNATIETSNIDVSTLKLMIFFLRRVHIKEKDVLVVHMLCTLPIWNYNNDVFWTSPDHLVMLT